MTSVTPSPLRRRGGLVAWVALPAAALTILVACGEQPARDRAAQVPGGNPERGARLITTYGCGSCHTVAGVRGADGMVGPPLTDVGKRTYLAGELPTGAQTMQRWIRSPQSVEPGTAMPDLGVTAQDARDLAAFLLEER